MQPPPPAVVTAQQTTQQHENNKISANNNKNSKHNKKNKNPKAATNNGNNNNQQNDVKIIVKDVPAAKGINVEDEEAMFNEQETSLVEVITEKMLRMFGSMNAHKLNEEFLQKHDDSHPHRLQGLTAFRVDCTDQQPKLI